MSTPAPREMVSTVPVARTYVALDADGNDNGRE